MGRLVMPLCKTCTTLPEPAPRETRILVAVPTIASEEALYAWSDDQGFRWGTLGSGLVSIELHGDGLDRLTERLAVTMSSPELAESRVLLYDEGAEFRPLDLLRTDTADAFIAKIRGEWLGDLLREGGLNTVFQPIFSMATGEVSAHECLMRASHCGRALFPGEIIGAARATGLMFHLDRAARIAAIENAAARGVTTDLFVNFNPTSIYNPSACLQTTVRAAEKAGIARERIVFEVVESDDVEDRDHLLNILRFYRKEGFRVALDDLGSGYSSLNLLTEILPDVAKLDMALIRDIDTDPVRQKVVAHLLHLARELGVVTVVEGVETAAEAEFCRSAGADLVQGYFFARPAHHPWKSDLALAA